MYELDENSRIQDVLDLAGGVTVDANLNKINLAYQVEDGQKIVIPSIKSNENENNIEDDEIETYVGVNEKGNSDLKVNINKATVEELKTLNGIGESTAKKIISYRDQNGKFKKIEDIKNVNRNR